MKNIINVVLMAVFLAFCLTGCVVTPSVQDTRYENGRPSYDRDRPGGYAIDISDISQRIAEMDQRIDVGLRNGALTRDEGQKLRYELYKIREDAARMQRDGRLTAREKDKLHYELDRLKKDIYREARDDDRRQVDISDIRQRIAEMDQRIDVGLRNGALTRDEGQKLRYELYKIREEASRMQRDGRLTLREKDRLNTDLDRLKKDIYREKHDRDKRW